MIKVSVIIPVYNAERFLRGCLNSVIKQSLREIEIICVDDASTDGSPTILSVYAKLDKRVKVLTQESTSYAGVARNRGMAEALGEYLVFWDADDFFEPDALERMYLQCKKDAADVCVCSGRIYDMITHQLVSSKYYLNLSQLPPALPFAAQEHPDNAFLLTNPAPWNKMFRKEFVENEGISFQGLRSSNDVAFVYTAIAMAQRITAVDRILINYRSKTTDSLQETNAKSPFCFYEALLQLRERLTQRNVFHIFERVYLELALGMCLYNLNYQKTKEAWYVVALRLKSEIFKDLGLSKCPRSYFSEESYSQLRWLLKTKPKALAVFEPTLQKDESSRCEPMQKDAIEGDDPIKYSVIIPVHGAAAYLEECLNSVTRQTLADIEIICLDDGSTEGSTTVLEQYQQSDKRIRVLTQEVPGLSQARNKGLQEAQGEYLLFLNCNDLLAWCALEHVYSLAQESSKKEGSFDLLFFEGESFYDPPELFRDLPMHRDYHRYSLEDCGTAMNGQKLFTKLVSARSFKHVVGMQIIRRSFLTDNNVTFVSNIRNEDNSFIVRCLTLAKRALVHKEPLYLRRIIPDSILSKKTWRYVYDNLTSVQEIEKTMQGEEVREEGFTESIDSFQKLIEGAVAHTLASLSKEEIDEQMAALPPDEHAEIALQMSAIQQRPEAKVGKKVLRKH